MLLTPPPDLILRPRESHLPTGSEAAVEFARRVEAFMTRPAPKWSAAYLPAIDETFITEALYFPRVGGHQVEVWPGTTLRVVGYLVEGGFMYAVCRGELPKRRHALPLEFTVHVAGIDVMAWRRGFAQLTPEKLEDRRRYRQMRSVANPELDKREKYAIAAVPWNANATWRAHVKKDPDTMLVSTELAPVSGTAAKSGYIGPGHGGWRALVSSLEPLPEGAEDIMYRVACLDRHSGVTCFMDIIQRLMDASVVSAEQLEAVTKAWADAPENN